jgi:hypothetical protein
MGASTCSLVVRTERVAVERSWIRYILAFVCLVPSALLNAHAYFSVPAAGLNLPYLVAVPVGLFGFILALTSPNLVRLATVGRPGVIRVTDRTLVVERNRHDRRWDLRQIVDAWIEPGTSTEGSMCACVIHLRYGTTLRVSLGSIEDADRLLYALSCHPAAQLGTDGVVLSGAKSLFIAFDHVTDVMATMGDIVFVLSDGRYVRIPWNGTSAAAVMRRVGELRHARSRERDLAAAARLGRGTSREPTWRARLEALDDAPATYRDPLLSTESLTEVACAPGYPDDVRIGAAFLLARRRAHPGLRRVALATTASVRREFRRQLEAAAAGFLETPSSWSHPIVGRLSSWATRCRSRIAYCSRLGTGCMPTWASKRSHSFASAPHGDHSGRPLPFGDPVRAKDVQ